MVRKSTPTKATIEGLALLERFEPIKAFVIIAHQNHRREAMYQGGASAFQHCQAMLNDSHSLSHLVGITSQGKTTTGKIGLAVACLERRPNNAPAFNPPQRPS